jgi:large subunit ribosomal protein LP1
MAGMVSEQELACIYAALILADDDIQVTAEKMQAILKAADVHVESIWPNLFAKSLQGQDIKQLIASKYLLC